MIGQRFSFDGRSVDYYWCINDSLKPDDPIWVDCPVSYVSIIVEALNNSKELK